MSTHTDTVSVIYILTNPSFPPYVKIGYADDYQRRVKQLNDSTAVPFAFRVYAIYHVPHRLDDHALHGLIDQLAPDLRATETVDGKTRTREFFRMSPEEAFGILENVARLSGTEDRLELIEPTTDELADEETADEDRKAASRRSRFHFSMIGLKPGTPIDFELDKSIPVRVADDTHVSYIDPDTDDEVRTSMSNMVCSYSGVKAAQGPKYFSYDGTLLSDMRDQAEAEDQDDQEG